MAQAFAQLHPQHTNQEPAHVRLRRDCPTCGFHNLGMDVRCQKCGRRLPPEVSASPSTAASESKVAGTAEDSASNHAVASISALNIAPPAPPRPVMPDHVRREIHSKVERFRARRQGQTLPLPFDEPVLTNAENLVAFPTLEEAPEQKVGRQRNSRESRIAHMEMLPPVQQVVQTPAEQGPAGEIAETVALSHGIPAAQPLGEVPPANVALPLINHYPPQAPLFFGAQEPVWQQWQALPIAPLSRRMAGHGRDLAYILCGIALFAAPFYWIGGQPPLKLFLLAGMLCGSLLLALLYGALFLGVVGETPGMRAAGIKVVSFDGRPASRQQRLIRVAGAMVSAGSFLFGFIWALVDEEKLYWHDHISKTFLTDSGD